MTVKVGVTGNIGSGKTTVCKMFETLNIPVLYADPLAQRLMCERLSLRNKIIMTTGQESFFKDGRLNKSHIGQQIFQDKNQRQAINQIVHKAVHDYTQRWFERRSSPYAIEEAALIYESGSHESLDYVIVVDAPQDIRIARVSERDGLNREDVLAREQAQLPADEKVKKANYVINNDGEASLIEQVYKIHCTLVRISNLSSHGR